MEDPYKSEADNSPPPRAEMASIRNRTTPAYLSLVIILAFTTPSVRAMTLTEIAPAVFPTASRFAAVIVDETAEAGTLASMSSRVVETASQDYVATFYLLPDSLNSSQVLAGP